MGAPLGSDATDEAPGHPGLRYRAFISYSHRDARIAQRLHRRLESYSVPKSLRVDGSDKPIPPNLRPVFRDRDELASAARLSDTIQQALDESRALIVICSPAAAASSWVNAEIEHFRRRHPERPVFAFVASGDPGLDPRKDPANAALPLALALEDPDRADGPLGEPVAADARDVGDGFASACLKLIAGLLGVRYDQLRQREQKRSQLRWALFGTVSLLLTAVFAFLAWEATEARDDARAAQARAELELRSEQQTRTFLLSVFELADANESRGNQVTVREVLDAAVQRIDKTRFDRPAIRSRFMATLGKAYSSLGLNRRSAELLESSIKALGTGGDADDRTQRIDSRIELADIHYVMGDYDAAIAQLTAIDKSGDAPSVAQQIRMANLLGDIETYREHDDKAEAAYNRALVLIGQGSLEIEKSAIAKANALSGLAMLAQFAGDHAKSERHYAEIAGILDPVVGNTHPLAISIAVNRGANAYASGKRRQARDIWQQALASARKLYDPLSPHIGTIDNNLGRLLMEDGDLVEAEPLLRAALASDRKHRSENFDDLAYPLANLAYVRFFRGDPVEAESLFKEARGVVDNQAGEMKGTILNGLADIRCSRGDVAAGLTFAEESVAENTSRYEAGHWRIAQARLTLAYCHAIAGKPVDRAALAGLAATIRKKFGAKSPFARRGEVLAIATAATQP